jgi:lysophospholipase L1-like esterase
MIPIRSQKKRRSRWLEIAVRSLPSILALVLIGFVLPERPSRSDDLARDTAPAISETGSGDAEAASRAEASAKDSAGESTAAKPTALPRVLILGDSISIGYTPLVIEGMKGKATVTRPRANCGDTRVGLKGIDKWLGNNKFDVFHFNWGLWDLCYRSPESKEQGRRDKVNGTLAVPLTEYEKNLEQLVLRMKQTGATLVWASTTLVPEGEAGRFAGDEVKYNAVAERVMKKHGVLVDDLHAVTKSFGPDLFTRPGDVHYKPEGYARLAAQVIATLEGVLKK